MRHEGERRALGAIAVAVVSMAFACSSRHRLGRLESDEPACVGGAGSVADAGTASAGNEGSMAGNGAASHPQGQAGEGSAGESSTPRLPPDVFVAH